MTMPSIAIIDYGLGNVRSIANALETVGARSLLTRDQSVILAADGVVLPGDLCDTLHRLKAVGKSLIGICLGMQMLLETSEEYGVHEGLGIIAGEVVRMPVTAKLPHVGWNEIAEPASGVWRDTIFYNVKEASSLYFVHTFAAVPTDAAQILTITEYGGHVFASSLQSGNFYGCQFHPEKSGEIGLKMLKNFVEML